MIVAHITPFKLKGNVYTRNLDSIYKEGLHIHSSVFDPKYSENFIHHGFRNNRKGLWGCTVTHAVVVYFDVNEKYLERGPDAEGHYFVKCTVTPKNYEIVERD